jgi:putative methionine-R-sulfoxide reductase with GAF domain
VAGWVAEHGTALLVTDIESDPRFGRQNGHQYETKSLLSVPVKLGDRVVGVININNKVSCTPFTEDDQALLTSLADRGRACVAARLGRGHLLRARPSRPRGRCRRSSTTRGARGSS